MKVAIIHSFYTEQVPSGENSVVRRQAEALVRAGLSVATISASTDALSESKLHKPISAYQAATGLGHSPMHALAELQPDIIHVHNLLPNFGTRWLRKIQAPVVMTLHNHRLVCANGLLRRDGRTCSDCVGSTSIPSVIHRCYRGSLPGSISVATGIGRRSRDILTNLNAVVALSQDFLNVAGCYLPGRLRRFVIPNFLPEMRETLTRTSRRSGQALYVGRLSEEKGIVELVRMWSFNRGLTIVGDGPCRSVIEELVRDKPNITLLGNLDQKSVAIQMSKHDTLIFPSLTLEPSSMTVIEALSLGMPIIAHDDNSVAAKACAHGFGVRFRSEQDLSWALERVDAAYTMLSRNARRYFESQHTEQVWVARTLDCYRSVI